MVAMSAWRKQGVLVDERRPAALAISVVKFWLQAITVMPKARPIRATSLPMLPSPTTPRHLLRRFAPILVCQPPSLIEQASRARGGGRSRG